MSGSVIIRLADLSFFNLYYSIKSEKSNIYWSGHAGVPDKNNLQSWFESELSNENRKIFTIDESFQTVGYLYIDKVNGRAEISYAIKESETGKGYATQAVKQALRYIKRNNYFKYKIVAYAAKTNKASRKVLENNSFVYTGNFKSHYFKSIDSEIDMLEYEYQCNKCLIIAEAGVNHNGSLEVAKKLIDAAREAGVDAIKFQTWKTELLVTKKTRQADYQIENTEIEETQYDMLKNLELSFDEFLELKKYCDSKNIMFLSTPDEIVSADFLKPLQDIFKIGSGELTNIPFLRHIGSFKKKIILSTGMGTLGEIENALSILINAGMNQCDITVLHATTMYPTSMMDVNLNAMQTIQNAFKINVGYSDHTMGIEVPIAAVAMGAKVIEKHFTLSRGMQGPDHKASLEPEELKDMVKAIRNIECALGDGNKLPKKCELDNKKIVRKSIVAKINIKKGDVFSEGNIETKRLGEGVSSALWDEVIGLKSNYNIHIDEAIRL